MRRLYALCRVVVIWQCAVVVCLPLGGPFLHIPCSGCIVWASCSTLHCLVSLCCTVLLCPEWALFVAAAYVWTSYVESEHPNPSWTSSLCSRQHSDDYLFVCLFVCEGLCVWVSSYNCTLIAKRTFLPPSRVLPSPISALTTLHLDRDLHLDWAQLVRVVLLSTREQEHSNRTWDWEGANLERSRWTIWHFAQRPKDSLGRSKRHLDISCRPFFIPTPMFPVKKLQESNKNHWSQKYSEASDMQHHIDARVDKTARFHRCLLWVS